MPKSNDTLYDLAERHAGYFTTKEAIAHNISHQLLRHHAESGTLQKVAHGVYRLKRFPSRPFEDVTVATLWAGEDAVASHETALAVHGVGDAMPSVIHVSLPRRFRGKRQGVVVHISQLSPKDLILREAVPVTTVLRTLFDVALDTDVFIARTALSDAVAKGLVTRKEVLAEALRYEDGGVLIDRLRLAE